MHELNEINGQIDKLLQDYSEPILNATVGTCDNEQTVLIEEQAINEEDHLKLGNKHQTTEHGEELSLNELEKTFEQKAKHSKGGMKNYNFR